MSKDILPHEGSPRAKEAGLEATSGLVGTCSGHLGSVGENVVAQSGFDPNVWDAGHEGVLSQTPA